MKTITTTGCLLCALLVISPGLYANDEEPPAVRLTIADPFIEMHTGPGSAYPIFYVVDRGDSIVILRRKTDWFRIRTDNGKEGWASKRQMQQTLLPDGQKLRFWETDRSDFVTRQWELGVTTGELKSAPIMSVYGGYSFTPNLSTELTLGHSIGNISSSLLLKASLLMQPFPEWDYSPFLALGVGGIEVKPSATLIDPADKSNEMAQVGVGFRKFLSRRFVMRFEANEYVIFSANNEEDNNEEISEWKIGFAIFF